MSAILDIKIKKELVELLDKAKSGDANAQFNYGLALANGESFEKDETQAVKWYQEAAVQGHKDAQFKLGVMLANGRGIAKNEKKAMEWYEKAAAEGHTGAQNNLGMAFMNGRGVEKNNVQAVEWFRKAAEQGFAPAQFNLGLMCLRGQGIAKSVKQANEWFRKAYLQGHSQAQVELNKAQQASQSLLKEIREAITEFSNLDPVEIKMGFIDPTGVYQNILKQCVALDELGIEEVILKSLRSETLEILNRFKSILKTALLEVIRKNITQLSHPDDIETGLYPTQTYQNILHNVVSADLSLHPADIDEPGLSPTKIYHNILYDCVKLEKLGVDETIIKSLRSEATEAFNKFKSMQKMASFTEILDKLAKDKLKGELDLSDRKLNNEQLKALAEALMKNPSITFLNLNSISLDLKGITFISKSLKFNTRLTAIHLVGNELGPEGGRLIADALKKNSTLTAIYLGGNELGHEGGKHIAEALKYNTSLLAINLESNNLGFVGGKHIAEALKSNTSLTEICLGDNNFDPEAVKRIVEVLNYNVSVLKINLECNNLGPDGGKLIADTLKHNTSLTEIYLGGNNLKPEEGKLIADALIHNTSLTTIHLRINNLSFEEKGLILETLKHNSSLLEINIECTNLGSIERYKSIQSIRKNITLLSPALPLPQSKDQESKEIVEFDYLKKFKEVLIQCTALETQGWDAAITQSLRYEALLAFCSWNQGDEFTVEERAQGALTTQERIDALLNLYKKPEVEQAFKDKVLLTLSIIAFDLGIIDIQENRSADVKEMHFLLAYTGSLHGAKDEMTSHRITFALTNWIGIEEMLDPELSLTSLKEKLAKREYEKLKQFEEAYRMLCKTLGLTPVTELNLSAVVKSPSLSMSEEQKQKSELVAKMHEVISKYEAFSLEDATENKTDNEKKEMKEESKEKNEADKGVKTSTTQFEMHQKSYEVVSGGHVREPFALDAEEEDIEALEETFKTLKLMKHEKN